MLTPIKSENSKLDLIYENLPNIPIGDSESISNGQNSSTFILSREEHIPDFISRNLITLHYLALKQAHPLLRDGGHVLSSIGGRIPLEAILNLGSATGYASEIITFTWKRQSEPEEVIGGYAQWGEQGFGPFRFYPAHILAETFESIAHVAAGAQAIEIEQALSQHEMTAGAALTALSSGMMIGHTVAMLHSVKK